jgi:hypothetical protein
VDVVEGLDALATSNVIPWACPVPFFGPLPYARVATVGINPSGREFLDAMGRELDGRERRLPTLRSLGLPSWSHADARHIRTILEACVDYFRRNPYDRWFKVLDQILASTGSSFYDANAPACHLDLVPYATSVKWGSLPPTEQRQLLERSRDAVACFLRESRIDLLILNGTAVVRAFEDLSGSMLQVAALPALGLPRNGGSTVPGIGYRGSIETLGGIALDRQVAVVGYNHNVQSSYGVTKSALAGIGRWVGCAKGTRR